MICDTCQTASHCIKNGCISKITVSALDENHPKNEVDAILNERGKRYGKFKYHADISQRIKFQMQYEKGWGRLQYDQRESLEMIAHKIARILNGDPNYADSWVDIAGYAQLIADRLQGIER